MALFRANQPIPFPVTVDWLTRRIALTNAPKANVVVGGNGPDQHDRRRLAPVFDSTLKPVSQLLWATLSITVAKSARCSTMRRSQRYRSGYCNLPATPTNVSSLGVKRTQRGRGLWAVHHPNRT